MDDLDIAKIVYRISAGLSDDELNWLHAASWPDHVPAAFQAVLQRSLLYVSAHAGERVVGFVNLAWDGGEHAFLLDTLVHPDLRRQGIGTELVNRAVAAARLHPITWVHVDFEPHLREFYFNCGFRDTEAGLIRLTED